MNENHIIRTDFVLLTNDQYKTIAQVLPDNSIKKDEFSVSQITLDNLQVNSGEKIEFTLLNNVELIKNINITIARDEEVISNEILRSMLIEYMDTEKPVHVGNSFELIHQGESSDEPWIKGENLNLKATITCDRIFTEFCESSYGLLLRGCEINMQFK